MNTTEHFWEKNIIYGTKNINLGIFFKDHILSYFVWKKVISKCGEGGGAIDIDPEIVPYNIFTP